MILIVSIILIDIMDNVNPAVEIQLCTIQMSKKVGIFLYFIHPILKTNIINCDIKFSPQGQESRILWTKKPPISFIWRLTWHKIIPFFHYFLEIRNRDFLPIKDGRMDTLIFRKGKNNVSPYSLFPWIIPVFEKNKMSNW